MKTHKKHKPSNTLISPQALLATKNIGLATFLQEHADSDEKVQRVVFKPTEDGLSRLIEDLSGFEIIVTGGKTDKAKALREIAEKYLHGDIAPEEKLNLKEEFTATLIDICGEKATERLIKFYSQTPTYVIAHATEGYFPRSSDSISPIFKHIKETNHLILKTTSPKKTLLFGRYKPGDKNEPVIELSVSGKLVFERYDEDRKNCKQLTISNKEITVSSKLTADGFELCPFITDTPNIFLKSKMDSQLEDKIINDKTISILASLKKPFKTVITNYMLEIAKKRCNFFKKTGFLRARNLLSDISQAASLDALKTIIANHLCRIETDVFGRQHAANLNPDSLDTSLFKDCKEELSILFNCEIPSDRPGIEKVRDTIIAKHANPKIVDITVTSGLQK